MGSALIPLEVKPANIESPLSTIGGLMQLRQGMTELALKQAQIEQRVEDLRTRYNGRHNTE